jgi:O-antigen/teichoic acid export membrane protein
MTINKLVDKYKNTSVFVRSSMWYTLCSFIQKGISFITVPIFTRLLTEEQFGAVSIFYSWETVLVVFCTLNLFSGVFNNGMIKYEENRSQFLSSLQGLVTTITVCIALVYLVFHTTFNRFLEMNTLLMMAMFLEILMGAAFSFWSARERFEFRYERMVSITLIASILAPTVAVLTILLIPSEWNVYGRVLSSVFIYAVIYIIIYIQNFKKGKIFFSPKYWKYGLKFNIPLIPHYLSTLILNQSDRIMISKMVGMKAAGFYSLSHNLAMVLSILTTSINNAFAPWLYQKLKRKDYNSIVGISNILFLLVAISLFLLMAFAPEIVLLMGGTTYSQAMYTIPPLATSIYFMFMYQIFANIEFYFEENKFIMFASVSGAALNMILNYFCIKAFGYIAAGYTTLVCYIIFGSAHYWFMEKTLKKNMSEFIEIFDIKYISGIAMVLLILTGIMVAIYSFPLIRYTIFVIFIGLVFLNKNEIIYKIKFMMEEK